MVGAYKIDFGKDGGAMKIACLLYVWCRITIRHSVLIERPVVTARTLVARLLKNIVKRCDPGAGGQPYDAKLNHVLEFFTSHFSLSLSLSLFFSFLFFFDRGMSSTMGERIPGFGN